jgi:CheY-like chemotaxis protein
MVCNLKNMQKSQHKHTKIFLADDDSDDCLLFEEALRECCPVTELSVANDGIELMSLLEKNQELPTVIFLDLNMPKKNGFECITEIRSKAQFNSIPIIIFSTTAQPEAVNKVYDAGANYYVCKPNSYQLLKDVIKHILAIEWNEKKLAIPTDKYVFQP